jgi:hypothetical protein
MVLDFLRGLTRQANKPRHLPQTDLREILTLRELKQLRLNYVHGGTEPIIAPEPQKAYSLTPDNS